MSNGIYDILGKLASLTPKEEPKQEASKPIYESVEARGSVLEGVSAIESKLQKDFVAEKAVSTAQQKFMGMVHATQKGEKAPSKAVAKAAKGMTKKAATDYASTKHKGLPQHVGEGESFVSDEVWRLAKQLSRVHGVNVEEFGAEQVDTIADRVGLNSSDVAEILELTQTEGTAGVCAECGMNEGECEHTAMQEAGLRGGDEDYEGDPDYEDRYNEDEGFFVAIGNEENGMFLGMITKDGGRWRETAIQGNPPYRWGEANYMSYLTSQDVKQWINKDYGRRNEVEFFDTEEEARDYFGMMSEGETTDLGGGRRVHRGTYGTEYQGDEDDEDGGKPSTEKRGRGRPKKGADSTGKVATYNAKPLSKALGIGEGEVTKTKTGIVHKAGPGGYGRQFDTDDEGNEVTKAAPQVKRGRGRPKNPANAGGFSSTAAKTLHDILNKKSKLGESINFKKLMDDTNMSVDEMIACMQNDIKEYKQTGSMSETLRDFLDLYRHGRKQADEAVNPNVPAIFRKQAAAPGEQWQATAADIDAQRTQHLSSPEGLAQRKREMGIDATHELNELAKLAGISNESIGAPQRTGYQDFCGVCGHNTQFFDSGTCSECGINREEWDSEEGDYGLFGDDERDDDLGEAAENPYQQRILDSDPAALDEFLQTGYLDTTSDLYNQMYDYYANQMPSSIRRNQDAQYDFITAKIREIAGGVTEADAPVTQPSQYPVNAPNQKYGTVKQITSQGDDLNRQKKQFASKPYRGDNPMAAEPTLEAKLQAEYDSIKKQK